MSLVGSLEDLGLADILQIVSLAQKSGRLLLRSGGDSGRILLRGGLVCGGAIKGERDTLRALLLEGDHVPPEQFEEASALAQDEGLSLVSAVARVTAVDTEVIESLRREHTERSVMRMFGWVAGEFSFEVCDVHDGLDAEDAELELTAGINAQYLAMEASRLRDEGVHLEATHAEGETPPCRVALEDPASEDDRDSPVDALALASAHAVLAEEDPTDDPDLDEGAQLRFAEEDAVAPEPAGPVAAVELPSNPAESLPPPVEAQAPAESLPPPVEAQVAPLESAEQPPEPDDVSSEDTPPASELRAEAAPTPTIEPAVGARGLPVVAMDPDLSGLEWLKSALADAGHRVHIFQQAEPALTRVRQYLVRGERPLVLVSPRIGGTPEAPDVASLVTRLRVLAPGLPVLELICEGRDTPGGVEGATATVKRPMAPGHDSEGWSLYRPLAESLRVDLERASRVSTSVVRRSDADVLRQLKALSQRLRNPQQEDVLSLAFEFASETFERVAVFMLRDDQVLGMAGRRLPADSPALGRVCWDAEALPALLHRALVERTGIHGDLADPGNEGLFSLLGEASAPAYAAPIESSGCVVALLYADAGVGGVLADTTALEIVLHEAGLALDRALLERTLKRI